MNASAAPLRIAVLLSGGGRTLENLIDHIEGGMLNAKIELVISSREKVPGIQIAKGAGIRAEVVRSKDYLRSGREAEMFYDWKAMSSRISQLLLPLKLDLVCMAGFLSHYYIPEELAGRVMNIHPALIPMFCGQGMYGHKVHEAVIASGVRVTGCTVHFVNQQYDAGPIILQRACPVYSYDTPDDVAARVFAEECKAYPVAIALFGEGRISIGHDGRVRIAGDEEISRFV